MYKESKYLILCFLKRLNSFQINLQIDIKIRGGKE
jgi:hypothetical protein